MVHGDEGQGPDRRDWRNPAQYADLHQASRERLAWEFLRRNPAYRQAAAVACTVERRAHPVWRQVIEIFASPQAAQARRWGLLSFRRPGRSKAGLPVLGA